MRKNINKLATLVMTGALAASMSFGAFADTTTTAVDGTVHKKLTVKENSNISAPNGKFIFYVTPVDGDVEASREFDVVDGTTTKKMSYDIKKGTNDQIDIDDVETSTNKKYVKVAFTPSTDTAAFDKTFNLKFKNFTEAGIYKFQLTESGKSEFQKKNDNGELETVIAAYPGVVYDTVTKAVYVFVAQNDAKTGYEVKNIVIANDTADNKAKIDTIVNKYGIDDTTTDDDEGAYKLTVAKEIAGNMAVASHTFTFNIKVDADAVGEEFVYWKSEDAGVNWTKVTDDKFVDGTSKALTVKGGTQYRIEGLTAGDVVSVKETGATDLGYNKIAYAVKDGAVDKSGFEQNHTTTEADTFKVSLTENDGSLTITNTREQLTPTGVVMDVAPYALMVALAGGAAATFLRKKESFED